MARTTAEVRQASDTVSTQGKEVAKIAQLKSSIKGLEDNVSFYKATERELKYELEKAIKDSTR